MKTIVFDYRKKFKNQKRKYKLTIFKLKNSFVCDKLELDSIGVLQKLRLNLIDKAISRKTKLILLQNANLYHCLVEEGVLVESEDKIAFVSIFF